MKFYTLINATIFTLQSLLSFSQRLLMLTTGRLVEAYMTVWSVTNYADAYWFLYSTKTMLFSYKEER